MPVSLIKFSPTNYNKLIHYSVSLNTTALKNASGARLCDGAWTNLPCTIPIDAEVINVENTPHLFHQKEYTFAREET